MMLKNAEDIINFYIEKENLKLKINEEIIKQLKLNYLKLILHYRDMKNKIIKLEKSSFNNDINKIKNKYWFNTEKELALNNPYLKR